MLDTARDAKVSNQASSVLAWRLQSSGEVALIGGASSCRLKGRRFDSLVRAHAWVGGVRGN